MKAILILLMLFFALIPAAYADETVISAPKISVQPGLVLQYESYLQPRSYQWIRENFSVRIVDRWTDGVSFSYEAKDEQNGVKRVGTESLSSLDDCPNLDPWWDTLDIGHDDRCELWASKRVYREIVSAGKSLMNIDTVSRKDTAVRWELVDRVKYLVEMDGQRVLLDGIKIKTSRSDEIIMMDDPDNPLILRIKTLYFSWDLRKIMTAG